VFRLGLVASLALTGAGAVAVSGQDAPAGAGAAAGEDAIGVLHVQGKVHMVRLPGDQETNLAVQVGEQGILLVDTGPAAMADRLLATLREHFGDKRIMMLVNTHVHPDHAGGNMALQAAMAAARAAAATGGGGGGRGNNPAIRVMAHENTLNRMNGAIDREEEQPLEAWPTSTFFTKEKELFFNGEPIEIFSVPNAHTDGDVMVFFRGSDVIASGDVFVTNSYPMIDRQRGGSIQGVLDGLNHILDLTVPEFNQQGGTRVIPGHGRLSNEADVDDYRNFMTIIRDRILDLARKGRTLEQVKAAHPTLDFDGVFENPAYAPATFIETVYEEVVKTVNPAAPARPGR
jgi:glyoxylase-like metal-dependent hydrolase (beta-lactamase superfamily II)